MQRHIAQPLELALLVSTVATFSLGCELGLNTLDAGQADESGDDSIDPNELENALECLIGTEVDATGVEQSSWETPCGVVCAKGWGHDGPQLPIAWTTSISAPVPGMDYEARALGLLDNGRVVVAIETAEALSLEFFEPDGVNIGGYEPPNISSTVFGVEIDEGVLYVTHGMDDGIVVLSAVGVESQQELWTRSFSGAEGSAAKRGSATVGLVLTPDAEAPERELVMLDLDGEPQWTQPTLDFAGNLAFSPSGARVAVIAADTRVYATADGALVDELTHDAFFNLTTGVVAFVDEDRLVSVGAAYDSTPLEGWLAGDSLVGGGDWEQNYNRATSWCPDEQDEWATGEWLNAVAPLADGSVLAVGLHGYKHEEVPNGFGSHPLVLQFTPEGEFLASDGGLWDGFAIDTVAAPDGSAYVLSVDVPPSPNDEGFRLRKYTP